ncbi:DUF4226 domain-containing protein [Mycobacterium sp.]|uniref:DUF4226 domain-containing protein n=1 Tax=Mycobacterium sp. TaxID=1785 RepID=UPI003A86C25D
MADRAGPSVEAAQRRQAALVRQQGVLADADRVLAEVLDGAHACLRDSVRRLEALGAEIEQAVRQRAGAVVESPLAAREFQLFLVAKQREIASVVAAARDFSRTQSAVLEGLAGQYSSRA